MTLSLKFTFICILIKQGNKIDYNLYTSILLSLLNICYIIASNFVNFENFLVSKLPTCKFIDNIFLVSTNWSFVMFQNHIDVISKINPQVFIVYEFLILSQKYVIVIEEEIVLTPDFLHFLSQCLPALEADDSLFGVSAFNYNGMLWEKMFHTL